MADRPITIPINLASAVVIWSKGGGDCGGKQLSLGQVTAIAAVWLAIAHPDQKIEEVLRQEWLRIIHLFETYDPTSKCSLI